jgi:hypothetical protein
MAPLVNYVVKNENEKYLPSGRFLARSACYLARAFNIFGLSPFLQKEFR